MLLELGDLMEELDRRALEPIVEYIAGRLQLNLGERAVTFEFSNGNLRRTHLAHGPVGNAELEQIAKLELSEKGSTI